MLEVAALEKYIEFCKDMHIWKVAGEWFEFEKFLY